jgi:putative hydrolase of the HAD superfamily
MVDFPDELGKMCNWPQVCEVDGARTLLASLSKHFNIFVATGAADSSVNDIKAAFRRAGLENYISGYFCHENLGVGKESSSFFDLILHELNVSPDSVLMIGDSLDRDVLPSISAGIHGIWFNPLDRECPSGIRAIKHLSELVSIVDQFD